MSKLLIKGAQVVNEGLIKSLDVLIDGEKISKIDFSISTHNLNIKVINAEGLYLIPGLIDDQVHFREPGLTHKATIYSESRAAIAGGITSFMDMPNTIPNTLTQELLEDKYDLASKSSLANYSFFMGINKDNLEEALKTNTENVCGITDDGLYFNNDEGILANYPEFLDKLFSRTETLVALHSEDDTIIKDNIKKFKKKYGQHIPLNAHSKIRSEEACLIATKRVIEISKKHNNRLHFFHISTFSESMLFDNHIKIRDKRITAEVCIHHLYFSDKDYNMLGSKIKWNPSIKSESDRKGLLKSLFDKRLDIIATDHAPHSIKEKSGNYFESNSGGPLVQHALLALLELYHKEELSLEKIVETTSHNVSEIYRIKERGYIREGYFADLVLINLNKPQIVSRKNILYKCGWSPFEHYSFNSSIEKTFVNGNIIYENGSIVSDSNGKRLLFEKLR